MSSLRSCPRSKPEGQHFLQLMNTSKKSVAFAILFVASVCSGCSGNTIRSEAGPTFDYKKGPTGPDTPLVGMVNGLWRCEPAENEARLAKHPDLLGDIDPAKTRDQCQVRVGFKRGYPYPIPLPGPGSFPFVIPMSTKAMISEYVLLPAGWKVSLTEIINDGSTVNVGDVVEVRLQKGRIGDWLVRTIRKCNDPPAKDEPHAWKLGCKRYNSFNEHGYAGEKYFWTVF